MAVFAARVAFDTSRPSTTITSFISPVMRDTRGPSETALVRWTDSKRKHSPWFSQNNSFELQANLLFGGLLSPQRSIGIGKVYTDPTTSGHAPRIVHPAANAAGRWPALWSAFVPHGGRHWPSAVGAHVTALPHNYGMSACNRDSQCAHSS